MVKTEIERRYGRVREAMAREGVDALIVSGNEYTGFEGAVTYMSGFVIVHRYAYVLLPLEGEPSIVFPSEARYVGEHGTTWIEDQVFVDHPGAWLADRLQGQRVGVYGLDYVMAARDYRALDGLELVPFDVQFDLARAVKSELELESVRDSVRINTEGFWIFLEAYEPGKTEREVLAPCEQYFVAEGCGRLTMDMVLVGPNGSALPEFKIAGDRVIEATDLVLPSLEIAGPGGHWVEVSRAITAGAPSVDTGRMMEAYDEYYAAAKDVMKAGATAHDVHRAVSRGFTDRGYKLGHVTGPLDRDDDDRVPEDRRGGRDRARGEHDLLDAPARDLRGRAGVPLHAGHVARRSGRRRAARAAADADLLRLRNRARAARRRGAARGRARRPR